MMTTFGPLFMRAIDISPATTDDEHLQSTARANAETGKPDNGVGPGTALIL